MLKINTTGITPHRKLFHNEWLNTYAKTLTIDNITYWRKNNRTIFTFDRLIAKTNKKIEDISIEEITEFVAAQDIHKLEVLAESIGRNGVQVPLIIRDDGKLLDGNRRYFACKWLEIQYKKKGKPRPTVLNDIPVSIIKAADLTPKTELKILAEANFIADLKVSWSLDAQARAVRDYYNSIIKDNKIDVETAISECKGVFGIERSRVLDLMESLELTETFIAEGKTSQEKMDRRIIVEEKFIYVWEFRNKAMRGRGAISDITDLKDLKDFFFAMMEKGKDNPIRNLKQIEPLIQAKRDKVAWTMLKESNGAKLPAVVAMINEKREIRKAEDRIRAFHGWLEEENNLTTKAKAMLKELSELALKKCK